MSESETARRMQSPTRILRYGCGAPARRKLTRFAELEITGHSTTRRGCAPIPDRRGIRISTQNRQFERVHDDLLVRAVAGETAALEQLLVPFQSRLLARMTRKLPASLRGSIAPEDLLQETFVEVFRQIPAFRPQGHGAFVRWLLMVADGRLIHAIRRQSAAKRGGDWGVLDPRVDGSSAVPLLEILQVDSHSPSRSFAGREVGVVLSQALAQMKVEYREAVRLRFLEGLSVADIAQRMGRTEWSVHKLCNRGLRELRGILGDEAGYLSRG